MKKLNLILFLFIFLNFRVTGSAQLPVIQVIQAGIKKAIVALDLKVQRIQTKVIGMQNAQKELENRITSLHLKEIAGWAAKQKQLYQDYFDELYKVKSAIRQIAAVKNLIADLSSIAAEYKKAWRLFKSDTHFSAEEKSYMQRVYSGMLVSSGQLAERISLLLSDNISSMKDGQRLNQISQLSQLCSDLLRDLRQFNEGNKLLSLQRVTDKADLEYVKKLYDIN